MATYSGAVTHMLGMHAGRYDYFHGQGNGVVAGTVKTKATPTNLPTFCKVWLIRFEDKLPIAAQWTNAATGAFSFANLSMDYTYTVEAFDHTLNFRAVIADRVAPVEIAP